MKALVKKERKPGLWIEDVPRPEVGINDVLIHVDRTGICGTDLHIYKWDAWAQQTIPVPMVVGHEFVGEVAEVGSNVKDFFPGETVSAEGHVVCGRCRNCLAGRRHLCKDTLGIGVNRPGAFAEYISVPMTNVWHHRNGIDRDVAAIFDPFGNAVHTALSFPLLGEDVLIAGAGPIGIMAAAVARHAGARFVVVTDVNDYRLDLARQMGASVALNVKSGPPLRDVQQQLGMKEGFDVGLEMSGSPAALREMIDNMCHGGKIAMLGLTGGKTATLPIDLLALDEIDLLGVRSSPNCYPATIALMATGAIKTEPLTTFQYSLDQIDEAFAALESKQVIRPIVLF